MEELFDQLHAAGRTVLVVDHDIERLRICQRIVVLRGGRVALDKAASDTSAAEIEAEMNGT